MQAVISFRSLPLALALVLLGACASTRSVMEWRNEAFTGRIDNVLVIAAVNQAQVIYAQA